VWNEYCAKYKAFLGLCTEGNFLTWISHCRCRFNIESSFLEKDVTCFARHPSPIAQEGYVIMASNKWNRVVSAQHLSSVMAVTALCQTNLLPGSKSGLTDTSNIYSFDGALSWGINGNFNVCSSQENGANIWLGALGKVEQYLKGTSKLTGTVEKVCSSWAHVSELLLENLLTYPSQVCYKTGGVLTAGFPKKWFAESMSGAVVTRLKSLPPNIYIFRSHAC